MKKNIIISGPPASGKSWIAIAIDLTHKKVIHTTPSELYSKMHSGWPPNLSDQYSLIIIDACKSDDIFAINGLLKTYIHVDNWDGTQTFKEQIPTIYLTQEHVGQTDFGDDFHVINCNNRVSSNATKIHCASDLPPYYPH